MLLQNKWNMANNLFQFNNWLIKCSKRRLVSVQCREKNNNTENLLKMSQWCMLLICRNPQSEPEYQTQEDSLLARKLLWVFHFVSVLCGLKESSWSVSLDYRKELIAKKHQPPPPLIFPPTCSLFRGNPKGYSFVVETEKCLFLFARKRRGGGRGGGIKCSTRVWWVALMGQRLSGKFCG